MTDNQIRVLAVLRKREAWLIAATTEDHWRRGETYYLDSRLAAAKGIRRAFKQGNREALKGEKENG